MNAILMETVEKILCLVTLVVKLLIILGAFWVCMAFFFSLCGVDYILWASITTAIAAVFCSWLGFHKDKESDD
jgi:membrane associated rhomboid family serine protease